MEDGAGSQAEENDEERPFRIYICGSYRDVDPRTREAEALLRRVEAALRAQGFDAYTQLHPRAVALAGRLRPAPMTRRLEEVSDLTVYVAVPFAREGGWVAEVSDAQARYPEGAWKRAVLVRSDFVLTAVLDNAQEGHLDAPFVPVLEWETEDELVRVIGRLAVHLAERGALPAATRRPGRLRWGEASGGPAVPL